MSVKKHVVHQTVDAVSKSISDARVWESSISAWAHIDHTWDGILSDAGRGPLSGVPFAVKDVIDVVGMPTRFGSRAFENANAASKDAEVVRVLRQAGAVPIGKTRTTEFAFIDPTVTRNPYNPEFSPGGSSSGSGAVVGAGIVPFSLGTQTAGSLCRPACYCGAYSYKPSYGRFPVDGMAPLSRSFDTIGAIAESLTWISAVYDVLDRAFPPRAPKDIAMPEKPYKIGLVQSGSQSPSPELVQRVEMVSSSIKGRGHIIETVQPPIDFHEVIAQHRTVMLAEAAASISPLIERNRDLLQPKLNKALLEGENISETELANAFAGLAAARQQFWGHVSEFDLLMAYPTPDGPPLGLNTTGDQTYLTPWTVFGGPLISCPIGLNSDAMPLGILFCGKPDQDASLIKMVSDLSSSLPATSRPLPPA